MRKRVLVGMSGGIDSSAVCIMLQKQGYEVVGFTMRVWDLPRHFADEKSDTPDFILSAQRLAQRLGIEYFVADERKDFKDVVVKNFLTEYLEGRTPNPCVLCNKCFKFRSLSDYADRLGCQYISTGHYVRLEQLDDTFFISKGRDEKKDQSYFLWALEQKILRRCIFPLGEYKKQNVRDFLSSEGFAVKASEKESMEVCFVEKDYRTFLKEQVPAEKMPATGLFVDTMGKKLGTHCGIPFYTVGQRKGLGIALGHPAYVLRMNAEKNTVVLGDERQLEAQAMLVEKLYTADERLLAMPALSVRVRYHSKPVGCTIAPLENEKWLVRFSSPVSAVTPGQSAVFYVGDKVVAGSVISAQKGIGFYLQGATE